MMKRLIVGLVVVLVLSYAGRIEADPIVPGFVTEVYATGITRPTGMTFDPSGVMYVAWGRKLDRLGPNLPNWRRGIVRYGIWWLGSRS